MIPQHHPGADLLIAYANGTAPASLELLVATHLVFCPSCRADVSALETLAGQALLEGPLPAPASLDPDFERRMAERIAEGPPPAPAAEVPGAEHLPLILRERIPDGARWTGWAPGFREIAIPGSNGPLARIVRLSPGTLMPLHTHDGEERTLILHGELTDTDVLRTGDLAIRDGDVRHTHRVTSPDPCFCLVVNDHDLVHLSWSGRLFRWISDRIVG
jgi:putative transcriptional regulator